MAGERRNRMLDSKIEVRESSQKRDLCLDVHRRGDSSPLSLSKFEEYIIFGGALWSLVRGEGNRSGVCVIEVDAVEVKYTR